MEQAPAGKPEETTTKEVTGSFKGLIQTLRDFIQDRLSIQDNAEPENTIAGIERDIMFRGFNLWILILAILIASVGLNANSTAVIIGAMLISPLMGPIMGLGLSIGINDFTMLKRSLRNLSIAVTVAIITSTLFFFIIPIQEVSSELLARTQPDIRDVFIGFFGGFAGILAGSRREKNNVIPGVAIATALMPPLCTAGYGIATGQLSYFIGAAYLFLINAFFIALATVLVVRYLKFPVKTFVNSQTKKRTQRLLILTVLVMIVPASIIFVRVVKRAIFKSKVEQFVKTNIRYDDTFIANQEIIISDTVSYINVVMFGELIPQKTINLWQKQLNDIVDNTRLRVFQGKDGESLPEVQKLVDMYTTTQSEISGKEETIKNLEELVKRYQAESLPISLLDEIRINYPEVNSIKMGRMVYADYSGKKANARPNFFIWWDEKLPQTEIDAKTAQIHSWLQTRLAEDSVNVTTVKY